VYFAIWIKKGLKGGKIVTWIGWLDLLSGKNAHSKKPDFKPLSGDENNDELRRRVSVLTPDEVQVYKWLRESYSLRWIAETLMKKQSEVRTLTKQVCRKLGVGNTRGVIRFYAILDKDGPEPVVPDDPNDL